MEVIANNGSTNKCEVAKIVRKGLIPIHGDWYLDTNPPVVSLNYGTSENAYWLPIENLTSAGAVLDMIAHIAGKAHYPSEAVGDLVRSINYLLDLRGTFVGGCMHGGKSREIADPEIVALRTVYLHPLPCEQEAIRSSVHGSGDWSLASWLQAQEEAVSERLSNGRFDMSEWAEDLLDQAARSAMEAS